MSQKELFINSIDLIDIHGSTNIPTVLHYKAGAPTAIGSAALSRAADREEVNEDFKVDLGNFEPGSSMKRFGAADGTLKSAGDLTADFVHLLLQAVEKWLSLHDIQRGTNILVAEPLAMQEELVSSDWLSNYRSHMKRILTGKGFSNIAFLPEPFAAYQYYRHGYKHPLVAGSRKHNALVMDFGGGTFDVCLIETTKEGDVFQKGRQAKPLAASSNPVGGFYINRAISEALIRKLLEAKNINAKLHKGFDLYRRWRRDGYDISTMAADYRAFIRHFHRLSYRVEELKIALCRLIRNWSLDAPLSLSVPIAVPQNPFAESTPNVNVQYSALELRQLFISTIWNAQLKKIVTLTLQRGKEQLGGAPITIVLLSGGSANIGWLPELLKRDFGGDLSDAQIIPLEDFQEVVAKGLAVECARRNPNEKAEGDFSSVTYNRVCLVLDPDDAGLEVKRFLPKTQGLPDANIPGVLLDSASVLTTFRNTPMRWRVHLDEAPRKQLGYYFLRSSFDPNDVKNLQNVEETVVHTPKGAHFDRDLYLELRVSDDGTTIPKFVYRLGGPSGGTDVKEGRPFFLDMTSGELSSTSTAYIGLDFGTSNTSVSFVDERKIKVYERRSSERTWNDLSDLCGSLPYPLAAPLATYLCQTDSSKMISAARDFVESALTLAAYSAYLEHCALKGRAETRLFKGFTKRSAGPLWSLLRNSMNQLGKRSLFCSGYGDLFGSEFFVELDTAITLFGRQKHGKVNELSFDTLRPVQIIANISNRVFADQIFGAFQQVLKKKFGVSYEGFFRHASGRPPFIDASRYSGSIAFSEDQPFVVSASTRKGIALQPLAFWDRCPLHPDLDYGHCYMFDSVEGPEEFSYKAVAYPCTCIVTTGNNYGEIATRIVQMLDHDLPGDIVTIESLERE